jgi:ribosomal protein S5
MFTHSIQNIEANMLYRGPDKSKQREHPEYIQETMVIMTESSKTKKAGRRVTCLHTVSIQNIEANMLYRGPDKSKQREHPEYIQETMVIMTESSKTKKAGRRVKTSQRYELILDT